MSNVILALEAFAGSEISKIITDTVATANRCGCWARININGIEVLAAPHDNAAWLLRNYELARERGAKFVSANVVPNPPRKKTP